MVSHEVRNPLSAILQSADGILTALETIGLPILHEEMILSTESSETVIDSAQTIIVSQDHRGLVCERYPN